MHDSWLPLVQHLLDDPRFKTIIQTLMKCDYNPHPSEYVFKAFEMPVHKVKIIMMGQSPYPQREHCSGFAFALPYANTKIKDWPASLITLAKASMDSEDLDYIGTLFDPDLYMWKTQGVLLLNAALTIPCFSKQSVHKELWRYFVQGLLNELVKISTPLIFYFMGSHAKEFINTTDFTNHFVYSSIHPAACAYDPTLKFDGKFKEIAEKYKSLYGHSIDWMLPF